MFEVGKLSDEAMDSFMAELDKVGEEPEGEGEAQRYFHHAVTLRNTVQFLRNNSQLTVSGQYIIIILLFILHVICVGLCSISPVSQSLHEYENNMNLLYPIDPLQ